MDPAVRHAIATIGEAAWTPIVAGRAYNLQSFQRAPPPYDEGAWTRLSRVAEHAVATSYPLHKTALAGPNEVATLHEPVAVWTTCGGCWPVLAR